MAAVTGSQLTFLSDPKGGKTVNLILSDGTVTTGAVDANKFNIQIFTGTTGTLTPLPGVQATATVQGALQVAPADVQAGEPTRSRRSAPVLLC